MWRKNIFPLLGSVPEAYKSHWQQWEKRFILYTPGGFTEKRKLKETASPWNLYIILTKGDKLCKNDDTKGKGFWLLESKYMEKLMEDKELF